MRRILTTNPRSGTHYLKTLISTVLGSQPIEKTYLTADDLDSMMASETGNQLVYGHFQFTEFGPILDKRKFNGLRLVVLTRYPLDRLISQLSLERARGGRLPCRATTPQQLARELLLGLWDGRPWDDGTIVEDYAAVHNFYLRELFTNWVHTYDCHVVKFEHLVARPSEVLAECIDYLRIEATGRDIERALDLVNFRTLSDGRQPGQMDPLSHYRCGLPGEWRSVFSAADIEALRPKYGQEFQRAGYDL